MWGFGSEDLEGWGGVRVWGLESFGGSSFSYCLLGFKDNLKAGFRGDGVSTSPEGAEAPTHGLVGEEKLFSSTLLGSVSGGPEIQWAKDRLTRGNHCINTCSARAPGENSAE